MIKDFIFLVLSTVPIFLIMAQDLSTDKFGKGIKGEGADAFSLKFNARFQTLYDAGRICGIHTGLSKYVSGTALK